ncbi:hypothetical protein [Ekhidna sp.]|uniref:hypothetical protein n=1 Tax=Ekhidna sp. TaxID=2608089 RepID=UPI0032992A46
MIRALFIGLILIACSSEKTTEYWLKPENQNRTPVSFKVDDQYCTEATIICKEMQLIESLDDSTRSLHSDSKVDSSLSIEPYFNDLKRLEEINRKALEKLEMLKEDMMAFTGGYCPYDIEKLRSGEFSFLPVYPYRTVDTKRYWSKIQTRSVLKNILNEFDTGLDSLGVLYNYTEQDPVLSITSTRQPEEIESIIDELLKNKSIIEAILGIRIIQMATVQKRLKLKAAIIGS